MPGGQPRPLYIEPLERLITGEAALELRLLASNGQKINLRNLSLVFYGATLGVSTRETRCLPSASGYTTSRYNSNGSNIVSVTPL